MSAFTKVKLIDRYRACMLGGLIGDCLGAPFECQFHGLVPSNKISAFFDKLDEDGESKEPFKYTDDTAMARQIAKSLIEKRGLETKDVAKRFVDDYTREPWRGYGGAVVAVFDKLKASECSDPFKPAGEQFNGTGSYGNGAAMRAHPLGLFCYNKDLEGVIETAKSVAKITHAHPDGINGGILQSVAVQNALRGVSPQEMLTTLINTAEKIEDDGDGAKVYSKKLERVKEFLEAPEVDLGQVCAELGNDVSAIKSVPTALFCFLKCAMDFQGDEGQFEATLKMAIGMGWDTDTIASMACAVAGAWLGIVPEELAKKCEAVEGVKEMGEGLFNIAGC